MKINNDLYGRFIISQNIMNGVPIRYSYREKSNINELNGWTLYSIKDDDNEYVNNSDNFLIISAESMYKISFEIY